MKKNIFVSEGKRPLWQVIIAALAFTICIAVLVFVIFILYVDHSMNAFGDCVGILGFGFSALLLGIRFSVIVNIYFDLENRLYKKEYAVGPVKIGQWINLPNIEYISVFRQAWTKDSNGDGMSDACGHRYDVNVWHDTSKHFTIYSCDEPGPSFEVAKYLAERLKTDLLDATIPNDSKWIVIE